MIAPSAKTRGNRWSDPSPSEISEHPLYASMIHVKAKPAQVVRHAAAGELSRVDAQQLSQRLAEIGTPKPVGVKDEQDQSQKESLYECCSKSKRMPQHATFEWWSLAGGTARAPPRP